MGSHSPGGNPIPSCWRRALRSSNGGGARGWSPGKPNGGGIPENIKNIKILFLHFQCLDAAPGTPGGGKGGIPPGRGGGNPGGKSGLMGGGGPPNMAAAIAAAVISCEDCKRGR